MLTKIKAWFKKRQQKKFALQQILPYYKYPTLCGYEKGGCMNITADGKMCVAGKNYLGSVRNANRRSSVSAIFDTYDNDQSRIFIPSAANKLSKEQWYCLQRIHDAIAFNRHEEIGFYVKELGLFTMQELEHAK